MDLAQGYGPSSGLWALGLLTSERSRWAEVDITPEVLGHSADTGFLFGNGPPGLRQIGREWGGD